MQLTITDFKKNIKKYLALCEQEDIYLLKYGKVVVKMSAIQEDTVAADPSVAILSAMERVDDDIPAIAIDERKTVNLNAPVDTAKEKTKADKARVVKKAEVPVEVRAIPAVKGTRRAGASAAVADIKPTKAVTRPPKTAPSPAEKAKPKPISKPEKPYVPHKGITVPASKCKDAIATPKANRPKANEALAIPPVKPVKKSGRAKKITE